MTMSTTFRLMLDKGNDLEDVVDSVVNAVGEKFTDELVYVDLNNTKFRATITVTLEPFSLH